MTVKLEKDIKRFNGVSTDDKPTDEVPEGSTFHAVDTGEKFIFTNNAWEQDFRGARDIKLAALL